MPPPVPRPGIPPMTQAQAVSAPGILNRPPAPTATVPAPQPPVTKPLFPSAGQVSRNSWEGVYVHLKVKCSCLQKSLKIVIGQLFLYNFSTIC